MSFSSINLGFPLFLFVGYLRTEQLFLSLLMVGGHMNGFEAQTLVDILSKGHIFLHPSL